MVCNMKFRFFEVVHVQCTVNAAEKLPRATVMGTEYGAEGERTVAYL